jgi:hypothetical protein
MAPKTAEIKMTRACDISNLLNRRLIVTSSPFSSAKIATKTAKISATINVDCINCSPSLKCLLVPAGSKESKS